MAFVKMLQTVLGSEKDKVYDLDDAVARSLCSSGYAVPISASQYLDATRAADNDALRTALKSELTGEFMKLLEGLKAPVGTDGSRAAPQGPTGGGSVDFSKIASGEDPIAKANDQMVKRNSGIGEVLRLLAIQGRRDMFKNEEEARWAARRLQELSGEIVEHRFNESTGQFTATTNRFLPNGGIETITRTGTDSLSGGSTYGYALKPEFLGNLFEISMEQQVFVNRATQIPVSSGNEVRWPAWDQYQAPQFKNGLMQSAAVAGVTISYLGEQAPRVLTDASLNSINYKIVDLTAFTALSRDFVVDNYLAFDAALTRMIGRAFGWMEDYVSIRGTGIGMPQGYFNSGCGLTVNRAHANKISSTDLTAMIANASPMVWDDLRWITNITSIPQLAILQDSGGVYVFQPNALITQAMQFSIQDKSVGGRGAELMHRPMGTLLGFPVYFTEKVPTLGTTGDISLVSPSQYGMARRSGLEIAVSEHYYFQNDLIAYRMKQRHDGKMLWRKPYLQADGSSTPVSPIVLLN